MFHKVLKSKTYFLLNFFFININYLNATWVLPLDKEDFYQFPLVVHGTVSDINVHSQTGIRFADLKVIEVLRGTSEEKSLGFFSIQLLDRSFPEHDEVQRVLLAPDLKIGQEVILALVEIPSKNLNRNLVLSKNPYEIAHMQYGKLQVLNDENHIKYVSSWLENPESPLSHQELSNPQAYKIQNLKKSNKIQTQNLITLNSFLNKVRQ